ncbi:MAG: hypothetical protein V3V00_05710 [Saprospiraceae bacterium]
MSSKMVSIVKANYIDGYKIKLEFDDRTTQVIDFEELILSSRNPMVKKFQDINELKSFDIVYGDLMWNDYEMSFPIWDLYTNDILKSVDTAFAS